jgi:hypothetical protein
MASVDTESLTDFFLRLGRDESLLADYTRDPRHPLLSGDLDAVRATVEAEVARDTHVVTAPRMMIAPEPEPGEPEPDEPEPDEPEPDDAESRARHLVA